MAPQKGYMQLQHRFNSVVSHRGAYPHDLISETMSDPRYLMLPPHSIMLFQRYTIGVDVDLENCIRRISLVLHGNQKWRSKFEINASHSSLLLSIVPPPRYRRQSQKLSVADVTMATTSTTMADHSGVLKEAGSRSEESLEDTCRHPRLLLHFFSPVRKTTTVLYLLYYA
jgi:hypothetical protein